MKEQCQPKPNPQNPYNNLCLTMLMDFHFILNYLGSNFQLFSFSSRGDICQVAVSTIVPDSSHSSSHSKCKNKTCITGISTSIFYVMQHLQRIKHSFQSSYMRNGIKDIKSQQPYLGALAEIYERKFNATNHWQYALKVSRQICACKKG